MNILKGCRIFSFRKIFLVSALFAGSALPLLAAYQENADKAMKLRDGKKYADAIEQFKKAAGEAEKLDDKAWAYMQAVYLNRELKKNEDAIALCRKIASIPDVLPEQAATALFTAAQIYWQQKKYEEALKEFKKIETIPGVSAKSRMRMYRETASLYAEQRKYAEQLASLNQSIQFDPVIDQVEMQSLLDCYNDLLRLYSQFKMVQNSADTLNAMLKISGLTAVAQAEILDRLVGFNFQLGQTDAAIENLNLALTIPELPIGWKTNFTQLLAGACLNLGNKAEAGKILAQIKVEDLLDLPESQLKRLLLVNGYLLSKCGNYPEADKMLETVITMPKCESAEIVMAARIQLANAIRNKQESAGIAAIEKLAQEYKTQLSPSDRALLLEQAIRLKRAIANLELIPDYRKITEIENIGSERTYDTLIKMAEILVYASRSEEAIEVLEKALTLPGIPFWKANWGARLYVSAINYGEVPKKMEQIVPVLLPKVQSEAMKAELLKCLYSGEIYNGYPDQESLQNLERSRLLKKVKALKSFKGFDSIRNTDIRISLLNHYASVLHEAGDLNGAIGAYTQIMNDAKANPEQKKRAQDNLERLQSYLK